MGLGKFIKKTVKANTNVKSWISWDFIAQNARTVAGLAKSFSGVGTRSVEPLPADIDFNGLLKHYKLTEAELEVRKTTCFRSAVLCTCFGLFALIWMAYLFSHHLILPSVVAFSLSFLMFAYAFSEHFQYFQISQRRLNCTVREWFSSLITLSRKK